MKKNTSLRIGMRGSGFLTSLLLFFLLGCSAHAAEDSLPTRLQDTPSLTALSYTPSFTVTSTLLPDVVTPSPSPGVSPSLSLSPSSTQPDSFSTQPAGCLEPPEDYTRIQLSNATLNARTLAMLQQAAALYDGEIDILNAITQGSYTDAESASFGTHSGGGAVDLSVMRAGTYTVLWDEIEPLVRALRVAGFAAWLRDLDALYPGSPIHIHAVAIGDQELSYTARLQVYGDFGYFAGMDGLPPPAGQPPNPDAHGGPLICDWMR